LKEKGYWVKLLQKWGFLGDAQDSTPTRTDRHGRPYRSGYLANTLLSSVMKWESVMTMLRDLEPLFDHINISTAMHRLAKVSHNAKVGLMSALHSQAAMAVIFLHCVNV
jgi:hypothetical protein